MEKKTCRKCGKNKKITSFEPTKSGHRRHTCGACQAARKLAANPEKVNARRRRYRRSYPATYIVQDSKQADRRHGRLGNDLTKELVEELIRDGCQYCGEKNVRMTLDRIDNRMAHTIENVIPACIRCNLLRGSMPYAAWQYLVPHVKLARGKGLFGDWDGKKNGT